jgi:hypothetical protein
MSMEPLLLAQLLAVVGLVVGAVAYFLLIRRRRSERDLEEVRAREDSHGRAAARFRRLQRRDHDE